MPPPPGADAVLMQQSPMQLALKEARKAEETMDEFSGQLFPSQVFPVIQHQLANGGILNDYEPIPFKQLKELKAAHILPPSDWKSLAKAVLSGGEYLLWTCEYAERFFLCPFITSSSFWSEPQGINA